MPKRLPERSLRHLALMLALIVALVALSGCSVPPAPARQTTSAAAEWDVQALSDALPAIVSVSGEESSTLTASRLETDTVPTTLWKPPAAERIRLLDADGSGGRLLVCASRVAEDTSLTDRPVLLDSDGGVRDLLPPQDEWPHVRGGVFLDDASTLVLRARETPDSVETTLALCKATGETRQIGLGGAWPEHWYLASLLSVNAEGECAVVMKTQGTPAPDDDFAVIIAKLENDHLTPVTQPFYDDALYSAAPGPSPESIVFARPTPDDSEVVPVDLLVVSRSGNALRQTAIAAETDCDPGFYQDRVCMGSSDGALLFRQAGPSGDSTAAVDLEQVPAGSNRAVGTGLGFPPLGDQWLLVEAR